MESNKVWKTTGVCSTRSERQPSKGNVPIQAAPDFVCEEAEDFFTVVAAGNVGTVRQFLKKHRRPDGSLDFDVNSVNFQNDNAMSVAVDKGNIEVVKYLAQIMNVAKNSILLMAVHKGDLDMVKVLCESLNADWDCEHDETYYPKCVTPLMAAAAEGHYEIVGFLLERGHKICEPHAPGCLCKGICKSALAVNDALSLESSTLYTYTAMGSPAYVPYATADPIHYCFRLYNRLTALSKDSAFHQNYASIAGKVSQFASSLVSECRSSKEVELVLSQSYHGKTRSELPRLQMAIDFGLQEFVTNPKVQLVVQQKFHGHFDDWEYLSSYSQFITIISRMFMIPVAYISFLVNSQKSKYYAAPVNKMINSLAMHLVFLGLLFMETRAPKPSEHKHEMISVWSPFIFLYFYGFTGLIAYQILASGFRRFLKYGWNIYDLVMVTVFSLFVAFSVSSLVHVRMKKPCVSSEERKQWNGFDPQLMAEGFLVVAALLAYLKTLFWLQASKLFGPLQVTLWRLTQRLAWFCLFGVVALLGFSLSLSTLYSYYSGMTYTDPETKIKSTQEESFTDALSSFKTFFWGFFGQSSSSAADVVLDTENEHFFTQAVGYAALGSFFVLMVLVFKSMLIVTAVQSTNDDVHQTWLCRRTQFFMYFIDSPLLPPPFNLLPHRYSAPKDKRDLETAKTNRSEYKELAKALVERYFSAELKYKRHSVSTNPHNTSEPAGVFQRSRCRSL